jgi:hypothetical protein
MTSLRVRFYVNVRDGPSSLYLLIRRCRDRDTLLGQVPCVPLPA